MLAVPVGKSGRADGNEWTHGGEKDWRERDALDRTRVRPLCYHIETRGASLA